MSGWARWLGALLACGGCTGAVTGNQLEASYDPAWQRERLFAVAVELREVFVREGSEGLLRLRLHDDEIDGLFTTDAAERIRRTNSGLAPTPDERRWQTYRALSQTPVIGFCARGVRIINPGDIDGMRQRVFEVDRLLIVGEDGHDRWGAWIEGLILTREGWRLLPTVSFARQVEPPRRNHSDIVLWACDLAQVRVTADEAAH